MTSRFVKSTPLVWISVTANVSTPGQRREEALRKEWKKYIENPNLSIRSIIDSLPQFVIYLKIHKALIEY